MIYKSKNKGIKYIDIASPVFPTLTEELKVVSLFSGAGGLDLGLEMAGFETVACIENDEHCRATLKKNRPEWKVFEEDVIIKNKKIIKREKGDIRDIQVKEILKFANLKKGEVSLVVGGAPCQPFSNIGKREGANDKKNGDLFQEFVRFVRGLNPQAFIFENVAGITQDKHTDVIKYMVEQFKGLRYGISYAILNAASYGVPQRRERFFLVGIKQVKEPAFPLPTHIKIGKKSREAFINDLEPKQKIKLKNWVTIKQVFNKLPKNYTTRDDYAVMNISPMVQERMKLIKQGQNFKVLPMDMRPDCWKNGAHQGQDTFGRLKENSPSVTIRTAAYNPAKGMYIHPYENRGLDTIEMAALQSFPYEWKFKCEGSDKMTLVSGGKQIGNAVPPLLAKALGLAIIQQLKPKKIKSVKKPL